jgi:hypothetical protein
MGRTGETEYANESTATAAIGKHPAPSGGKRENAGRTGRFPPRVSGRDLSGPRPFQVVSDSSSVGIRANGVVAMAERSKYQENIIKNYYKNFDGIQLQKLGEQITDLYLAEGKARSGLWKKIIVTLEKLKIPKTRIDHLVKADNPAMLAKLLEELLAKDTGAVN